MASACIVGLLLISLSSVGLGCARVRLELQAPRLAITGSKECRVPLKAASRA